MAKWMKGQSGNINGRPKGAKNKYTGETRLKMEKFIYQEFDQIVEEYRSMKVRDKVEFFLRVANFVLPKLRAIEVHEVPEIEELLSMSPDQLQEELIRIETELNNRKNGKQEEEETY